MQSDFFVWNSLPTTSLKIALTLPSAFLSLVAFSTIHLSSQVSILSFNFPKIRLNPLPPSLSNDNAFHQKCTDAANSAIARGRSLIRIFLYDPFPSLLGVSATTQPNSKPFLIGQNQQIPMSFLLNLRWNWRRPRGRKETRMRWKGIVYQI